MLINITQQQYDEFKNKALNTDICRYWVELLQECNTYAELCAKESEAQIWYNYATEVIIDRFELGEKAIATDAYCSYMYAHYFTRGRFELGEEAIATSSEYSYWYAVDVMKGRFELGEEAIATDAFHSYMYAREVINGRFELGEKAIATDGDVKTWYDKFLKGLNNESTHN